MTTTAPAAELDPLRLDRFYRAPLKHRHPSYVAIVLRRSIRRARRHGIPDAATAIAILRDLDPLMCAAERHIPGWWRLDGLEPLLIECAQASGYPPRGANHTYGTHNPPGERTRLFTGTDEERALYRGLALGESRLDALLDAVARCLVLPLGTPDHTAATAELVGHWQPMIDAARLMRREHVAPVMAQEIAPWVSNSFGIGGRDCRGPTAAQLPVVDIDALLWGADTDDRDYRAYHAFYAAEQPPHRRQLVAATLAATGGRSLLTLLRRDVPRLADRADPATAAAALDAIEQLARRMVGFRVAHLRFAKPSLPQRRHGQESWGSGSFDPQMLDVLLHYARAFHTAVRELQARLAVTD